MKFLLSFLLILSWGPTTFAGAKPTIKADREWLRHELNKIGLSQGFINDALESYEPQSFEKVLTLNLLGFLRPPGEHMDRVTPEAVRETKQFMEDNKDAFDLAKEKYKVPPNVIAALLWIETRHGEDMGDFHTASVYMHLLQANRGKNREFLTKAAIVKNKKEENYTVKELRKLMVERTKKKAKWAEEQLIALAAARKHKHLDLKTLRGSYAGAFGLPQFIPSSYGAYAKSVEPETTPDLTDEGDAILSVAFYLAKSGWRNHKNTAKVNALMKYNNSRDYADSILEISKRALRFAPKNREVSSASQN
jgi:membrane-bound lytic murein transglycosylase B